MPTPTPARSPLALPKNLTMKLGYCDECSPKVGLAFGGILRLPKHVDPKTKAVHAGKLIEIDAAEALTPGESAEAFLARMVKKYVK
jgi:hypothetical protein